MNEPVTPPLAIVSDPEPTCVRVRIGDAAVPPSFTTTLVATMFTVPFASLVIVKLP